MNRPDPSCNTPEPGIAKSMRPTGCPSLRRIVLAKDGGICRIKLPCGQLDAKQARTVADVARRCAADVIEATNRSNLQLRGVNTAQANTLTDALIAVGLGSPDDGGDDVRNVMVSPAAGIDPTQLCDTTPLATQILALLQAETRFHALSAKFAVQLDGGENMAMLQHSHDIWLSAVNDVQQRKPLFAFGLAGSAPVKGSTMPSALAAVAAEFAPDLVAAIMQLFLDHASVEQTRMRHLLTQQMTKPEFLLRLRQRVKFPLIDSEAIKNWRRDPPSHMAHVGTFKQNDARHVAVGAVPVLGRLNGAQLRAIADIAETCGDGTLRFTPWQSVLLPNIRRKKAKIVLRQLQALGLAISSSEPLTHIIACTGSAGCAKGLADTKSDAMVLAENLQRMNRNPLPDVHLTGCIRSCAAAHIAPYTLLAIKPGLYDFYQRIDAKPGLGNLLAREISIDAASQYLSKVSVTENLQ